jgi:tRNA U34 5-carboxymethylaminomethyl modifying enzyme MnmG/GidA
VTIKNTGIKYTKFTNIGIKHYHIDHIYSVKECFINGILPEVAANPCNLQKLWHKKNLKKQANCWITKEEMLDRYHTWLKRNPTYIQDLKNNQNIIFPERFKYNDYYMQNIIK